MYKNKLLPIILVNVLIIIVSCKSRNNETYSNKGLVDSNVNMIYSYLPDDPIEIYEIQNGEIIDTVFSIPRSTDTTLEKLFQYIVPIQGYGRLNDYNFYDGKISSYFMVNDSIDIKKYEKDGFCLEKKIYLPEFMDSFLKDKDSDTIFLKECIYNEGYYLTLWTEFDSIYNFFQIDNTRKRFVLLKKGSSKGIDNHINTWQKEKLKKLGKEQPTWTSNPFSICSTRIIISQDSIYFDMFKFYMIHDDKWDKLNDD